MIPAKAVRLRRDLGQLLRAIKAHALLHRARRKRDKKGAIRATIDQDYRAVRSLMRELLVTSTESRDSKDNRGDYRRSRARGGGRAEARSDRHVASPSGD